MVFNSLNFILLFTVVFVLYYLLPHRCRWVLLLIASLIFYMAWRAELIFLILFSSFTNYFISLLISRARGGLLSRKALLIMSIVINLGLLFVFKYMMFVNHTFMALYAYLGQPYPISDFSIILPMGISFYTFQAMGYTIDVYRGLAPERNFLKFTLYITFFPQLVAGPIERAERLLPQLFSRKKFRADNVLLGAQFMIMGFFKKMVIADRVAVLVNTVYRFPQDYSGLAYILATVFFAFQIYCDFSGYSDIAVGAAKMLDIDLMLNFDSPYFSRSIREFWRRWHISLSTWFKDYLYIPLGGSRVPRLRYAFNIMTTFVISGLWHGADWTFLAWGALHGAYQIVEVNLTDLKKRLFPTSRIRIPLVGQVVTFTLVCFAWIFFRANTLGDAVWIITRLTADAANWLNAEYLYRLLNSLGLSLFEIAAITGSIAVLTVMEAVKPRGVLRFASYLGLTVMIFAWGVFTNGGQFIYFQF